MIQRRTYLLGLLAKIKCSICSQLRECSYISRWEIDRSHKSFSGVAMLYLVLHVNKVAIGLHQPIVRLALLGIQLNKIKNFSFNLLFFKRPNIFIYECSFLSFCINRKVPFLITDLSKFQKSFIQIQMTKKLQVIPIKKYTINKMSKTSVQPSLAHITNEIVNRILKLQQLFHQKILTTDLLNQLIATYVQAIECFDHTYTPMRKYFLTKIQYVVSQPEIDSMLQRNAKNQHTMVGAIRETVRATVQKGGIEEHITQEMLIKAMEQEKKKYSKHHGTMSKNKQKSNQYHQATAINQSKQKTLQQSQQTKLSQEQKALNHEKKIQLQMNLMKQVSQNIKNFQKQDKKLTKQTKRINALVVEQNNTLEARLAMRKKGKNRKKSIDQKFVQQAKDIMPVIQKEQLKSAQKQIEQAVQRMTARLTMRQGTNKGSTGLIISRDTNQEQKYRGRIKMKNQINKIQQDEEDLLVTETNPNPQKIQSRGSQNGTARFTLGDTGGRNRIKKRDTTKMDEEEEELM